MTDSGAFTLEKIPKNGRLDKYLKECLMILEHLKGCPMPLKQKDVVSLERFLRKIFEDCISYLKEVLRVAFPAVGVVIYYKPKEYAEFYKKLDEMLGPKPYRKATIVGKGSKAVIHIDFQSIFEGKPIEFVTNLSIIYLEELVHYTYPSKSETEIHELVCSVVEGFLEIKLPNNFKQERLKRARIYNGY